MKSVLLQKISSREAVVGIAGLGYVGLPLVLRFIETGFRVIGFDIDQSKVDKLNAGESYIKHIGSHRIEKARQSGRMEATTDFSRGREVDAIILCVPTPLGLHQEPDLSFVLSTMDGFLPFLRRGQLISLESTTYPGTTDGELRPRIERQGFSVGTDIFLVFSPEREDPGNLNFTTSTIPKVLGGTSEACREVGAALYGSVIDRVVPMSSTQAAEMTKLLENIYRSVNIGLVNELKIVADRMGIDLWEVIDAAATKPFGFTPFYPGPGLGGHCIPIDPFYLTWKAREYGVHTRFIELAGEINTAMPDWVVAKVMDALNGQGKSLNGSKVLVLGIAYKKNVDDMRESPSMELIEKLQKKGALVDYSDPFFPTMPTMRKYHMQLSSVPLTVESVAGYDCVLVATNHDDFDYQMIREHAALVVDTRGVYREPFDRLVRA